jgi:hypothetical protein
MLLRTILDLFARDCTLSIRDLAKNRFTLPRFLYKASVTGKCRSFDPAELGSIYNSRTDTHYLHLGLDSLRDSRSWEHLNAR